MSDFSGSPVEIFVFAYDEDNALEVAGNGADREFETVEGAVAGCDPEFHVGKRIFRITVEEVGPKTT